MREHTAVAGNSTKLQSGCETFLMHGTVNECAQLCIVNGQEAGWFSIKLFFCRHMRTRCSEEAHTASKPSCTFAQPSDVPEIHWVWKMLSENMCLARHHGTSGWRHTYILTVCPEY